MDLLNISNLVLVGRAFSPTQAVQRHSLARSIFKKGETDLGDKGSKDKGKKEEQKRSKLNPKEKRKLKRE